MNKKKIPWRGFVIEFESCSSQSISAPSILLECNAFMDYVDCAECIAIVVFPYENDEASTLVVQALLSEPNVRVRSLSSKQAELYIGRTGDYLIKLPTCDFWRNELCILGIDKMLILHTRENPRDAGLSVKNLLSNKLHGVDNTGNICVWPAEPLLLHTLLNVRKYTEMVRDKRVLEIGGGMTALAGLGLAVVGLCASVAVTDGHPDCVANQVRPITVTTYFPFVIKRNSQFDFLMSQNRTFVLLCASKSILPRKLVRCSHTR